jgi:hypothetical protein
MLQVSAMGDVNTTITEKIRMCHEEGNQIHISRTVVGGIIMPSDEYISTFERKGFNLLPQLEDVGEVLNEYRLLFHVPKQFSEDNPVMGPSSLLDLMESFVRFTPTPNLTNTHIHILADFISPGLSRWVPDVDSFSSRAHPSHPFPRSSVKTVY